MSDMLDYLKQLEQRDKARGQQGRIRPTARRPMSTKRPTRRVRGPEDTVDQAIDTLLQQ